MSQLVQQEEHQQQLVKQVIEVKTRQLFAERCHFLWAWRAGALGHSRPIASSGLWEELWPAPIYPLVRLSAVLNSHKHVELDPRRRSAVAGKATL